MSEINSFDSIKKVVRFDNMDTKKTLLAVGIIALLISLSFSSITMARPLDSFNVRGEERAIERFMDAIDDAAHEATSFENFLEKLMNLFNRDEFKAFPIIREILNRIIEWSKSARGFSFRGMNLSELGTRDRTRLRENSIFPLSSKKHFVISYGTYNRLNPFRNNQVHLQKEGLTYWRYGGTSALLRGRSLIIERQPFGIKQRVVGSQLGFMTGFRGLFIDIESRLTGNSYAFIMGRATRIRAFDLSPFAE
jgi:hypothetical protein